MSSVVINKGLVTPRDHTTLSFGGGDNSICSIMRRVHCVTGHNRE